MVINERLILLTQGSIYVSFNTADYIFFSDDKISTFHAS